MSLRRWRHLAPKSKWTSAGAPPRQSSLCCRSTSARVRPNPMPYPSELKYTKDHEWVRISGDTAEVGITDYAQEQLGDVVFVELPPVGTAVTAGTPFGNIE